MTFDVARRVASAVLLAELLAILGLTIACGGQSPTSPATPLTTLSGQVCAVNSKEKTFVMQTGPVRKGHAPGRGRERPLTGSWVQGGVVGGNRKALCDAACAVAATIADATLQPARPAHTPERTPTPTPDVHVLRRQRSPGGSSGRTRVACSSREPTRRVT
jgi:hypothetical protein